jgi:hypothetical protein
LTAACGSGGARGVRARASEAGEDDCPVSGAQPARPASDGPNCRTDDLRAVLVFDRRPAALSQIRFFDWERVIDAPGPTIETANRALEQHPIRRDRQ